MHRLFDTISQLDTTMHEVMCNEQVVQLLEDVDQSRTQLQALHPIDGIEASALDNYYRSWLARYTYNSNAIEGSTLSLEDTELVLEGEFLPTDSPARFVFAARGIADGMNTMREWVKEHRQLDIPLIQSLHAITALDVQPVLRGTFRPYGYNVKIVGTRVETADPLDIYDLLEQLLEVTNKSQAHPIVRAAAFHVLFENIHPFADGNGRVGRQVLNYMLMGQGYQPVAIKHDSGRSYGEHLEQWQVHHNPIPFVSDVSNSVIAEQQDQAKLLTTLRSPLVKRSRRSR